jgi:hypothetical protein
VFVAEERIGLAIETFASKDGFALGFEIVTLDDLYCDCPGRGGEGPSGHRKTALSCDGTESVISNDCALCDWEKGRRRRRGEGGLSPQAGLLPAILAAFLKETLEGCNEDLLSVTLKRLCSPEVLTPHQYCCGLHPHISCLDALRGRCIVICLAGMQL